MTEQPFHFTTSVNRAELNRAIEILLNHNLPFKVSRLTDNCTRVVTAYIDDERDATAFHKASTALHEEERRWLI